MGGKWKGGLAKVVALSLSPLSKDVSRWHAKPQPTCYMPIKGPVGASLGPSLFALLCSSFYHRRRHRAPTTSSHLRRRRVILLLILQAFFCRCKVGRMGVSLISPRPVWPWDEDAHGRSGEPPMDVHSGPVSPSQKSKLNHGSTISLSAANSIQEIKKKLDRTTPVNLRSSEDWHLRILRR